MNSGALVFLAAFFALSGSWFTFVVKPTMQVGRLQQTNMLGAPVAYPAARPGLAQQGLQVYRANGCAYCHSQQMRQSGATFQVVLSDGGTNPAAVRAGLLAIVPGISQQVATDWLTNLPKTVYTGFDRSAMDAAVKTLNGAGGKAVPSIVPYGPDIARGWGKRRTVAEDFLFDAPVMPGSQRAGPDLANAGIRLSDPQWHLRHLYAPRAEVKDSIMPSYRYLFETRLIDRTPSPEALHLAAEFAPPTGFEVVPTSDAVALAAYLVSLRADAPLFSAPMTVARVASAGSDTNSPTGAANAPTQAPAP